MGLINLKKQKLNCKENLVLSIAISLFLAFTFCVFGPMEIVLSSPTEFWFQVTKIIFALVIACVVVFAILLLLILLISKRVKIIYPLLFGAGIALYIQGNYILTDYGVMDGNAIDWGAFGSWSIVDTLIWLILIIVPVLLYIKKKEWFSTIAKIVSLGCVAVQIITLGTLLLTSDWVKRDGDFAVTTRGIDTVSAKENIVVFILDTFDEEFFREIQAENLEFLEPLDGFTHFNNATGMYPTTKGALPFILTGLANNNEMP